MRIEKVNESQIRCFISKDDLESRHLKLSELTYGSEKANDLFTEVMQWANTKLNFDTDDEPLMIEAVPLTSESLILIVTKVNYPDELDSRFSDFTDDEEDDEIDFDSLDDDTEFDDSPIPKNITSAHDVLRQYAVDRGATAVAERPNALEGKNNMNDGKASKEDSAVKALPSGDDKGEKALEKKEAKEFACLVSFEEMDDILNIAPFLNSIYKGENDLYKADDGYYYLLVRMDGETPVNFNKVCNVLTEFSETEALRPGTENFIDEHSKTIIKGDAIKVLSEV